MATIDTRDRWLILALNDHAAAFRRLAEASAQQEARRVYLAAMKSYETSLADAVRRFGRVAA